MRIQWHALHDGWFIRAMLWAILVAAAQVQAQAQDRSQSLRRPLTLSTASAYDLATVFTHRELDGDELSVRDILSPEQVHQFKPLERPGRTPNLGYRSTTLWLKAELDVSANAPDHWLVQVASPQLDRIEVFVVNPHGRLSRTAGGDHLPFSQRPIPHRHHVFPLAFTHTGLHTVLVRVQSTSSMKVPVVLLQPHVLMSQDHRAYSLLSLYFGLLAGLLAYNLLLFVAIRDPVYLHYIAFVAAMALTQLALTGFGAQFLWPEHPSWNQVMPRLSQAACALTAILFARRFLHSASALPRLDSCLRGMLFAWVLYVLLLPWMEAWLSAKALIVLVLCTIVPLLAAGLESLCARRTGARYFLLSWALLMIGAVTESLVALGWIPAPELLTHPVMLGSAFEMVLLSFALADRIKAERQAREHAVVMGLRDLVKKEEAERVSHEKSRFLAAVSHDLRQPLFALNLAAESLHAQDPWREALFRQMRSALESAHGLLDSITTMARLDRGSLRANMSDFSVQPLLDRIELTFEAQALAKGLRWDVTPSLACVHSDPVLLERMVSNLVSNAVRFTLSGGVVVSCRTRGPRLLLQVWDTGPGIDPAHHESIFNEYFRGEPETENDNGVGLGLSIVKTCAGLLGVEVAMRSVPGRGSCFSLLVPLANQPHGRTQPVTSPSVTEASV